MKSSRIESSRFKRHYLANKAELSALDARTTCTLLAFKTPLSRTKTTHTLFMLKANHLGNKSNGTKVFNSAHSPHVLKRLYLANKAKLSALDAHTTRTPCTF